MAKPINRKIRDEICDRILSGQSYTQISKEMKLNKSVISFHAEALGLAPGINAESKRNDRKY